MLRLVTGLAVLFWSTFVSAQGIPTVDQWVALVEEVRQHPFFRDLKISYAKIPAAKVGFSPVGVLERAGVDCVVVISEGDNPKMERMMQLPGTPVTEHAFLLTIAAHELGHCFRIRGKHLTLRLWQRVEETAPGTSEREALERLLSIEEAYADAYAFAYMLNAHPELYAAAFFAMRSLRHEPAFATPFYQVEPLYAHLGSRGLDTRLALHEQVEAVMLGSRFQSATASPGAAAALH